MSLGMLECAMMQTSPRAGADHAISWALVPDGTAATASVFPLCSAARARAAGGGEAGRGAVDSTRKRGPSALRGCRPVF
eukprot:gene19742-biopygen17524